MSAFEVVGAFKTNPGATIEECAAYTGQKLEVRAGEGITLEQLWAYNASGGVLRVRSPNLHDDVQGIRLRAPEANPQLLLPYASKVPLLKTETLTVETSGGGGETDNVFLLNYYNSLPGMEGNLLHWSEVQPQIDNLMGVEVAAKTGAVGHWGTPVALNSSQDLFRRPARYAVLGYQLNSVCGSVVLSGGGVGELRFGGPGMIEPDVTAEWFIRLGEETGQATIPVFDSQNVGQVNVELGGQTAEHESKVTFICAKLKG